MPAARLRRLRTLSLVVVAVVSTVACTSEPDDPQLVTIREVTEDLITDRVTPQAGLGDLTPTCPDVTGAVVGTEFECTATAPDGRILAMRALINGEGKVELATTNVITGDAMPSFERAAVAALNNSRPGLGLADDAIDCGDQTVVFPGDPVMVCGVEDPQTEATFDVTLTITDIEGRQFSLVVADQPRA